MTLIRYQYTKPKENWFWHTPLSILLVLLLILELAFILIYYFDLVCCPIIAIAEWPNNYVDQILDGGYTFNEQIGPDYNNNHHNVIFVLPAVITKSSLADVKPLEETKIPLQLYQNNFPVFASVSFSAYGTGISSTTIAPDVKMDSDGDGLTDIQETDTLEQIRTKAILI